MPTKNDTPEGLQSFEFHGVDLSFSPKGTQATGDCPFCGKENHLYVNVNEGLWDCKVCRVKGNVFDFLRELHNASYKKTTDADFQQLARLRPGINWRSLKNRQLCKSIITDDWLLPTMNPSGKVVNLHKVNDKLKLFATKGISLGIFGVDRIRDDHSTILVCEGGWDVLALDSVLPKAKANGKSLSATHVAIGLPGVKSCHKMLPRFCEGRDVILLPDKDDAGREAIPGIVKSLQSFSGGKPNSIRVIKWPDKLPQGYDVRELFRGFNGEPQAAWDFIKNNLIEPEESGDEDESAHDPNANIELRRYSDIESEEIKWLWPNRIPLGKLAIIQGNPGLGKTYLALDIAARLSRGQKFPDNQRGPLGETIFLTSEDDPADTIRPRLELLKADVSKIYHFDCVNRQGKENQFDLKRDLDPLRRLLTDRPNVRLLILDPLQAFLGKVDPHKNADVRSALGPLVKLLAEFKVSAIGLNHLNKQSQGKAVFRGQGSIGFNAQARAVWQVSLDPEDKDRRLFLPVKNNIAPNVGGLAFTINNDGLLWEKNPVLITAEDAETDIPKTNRAERCKPWLESFISGKGWVLAQSIITAGVDQGFSEKAIREAKRELGILTKRIGKVWKWQIPKPAPGLKIAGG